MLTQSFFLLCALLGTICIAAPYCEQNYVTVTVYQTVYEDQYGHLSSSPPVPSLGTYYEGPASSPLSSAAGAFSHYGYQSPPSMAPAPKPTMSFSPPDHLIPSVPQEYDTQAMANLQPQKECMMYYEAQGSSVQNAAAFVTFTDLVYNVVILEHIAQISAASCDGQTLTITFSGSGAFSYASSTWPAEVSNGLVFITHISSCGAGYPAERSWLLINSIQLSPSISTITCEYSEITLQSASKTIEVNFGKNTRPLSSQSGNFSNTATPTSSSVAFPSLNRTTTVISSKAASPTLNPVSDLDFDVSLDDSIGYLNPNASGFWTQLLPGVSNTTTAQLTSPSKRNAKRAFSIGAIGNSLVSSAQNAIGNGLNALQNTLTNAVNNASTAFSNAVSAATRTAVNVLNSLSPFTIGPWPFNLSPSDSASTPFGTGTVIVSNSESSGSVTGSITAYCIGCGVSGSFSLSGNFKFDVQQGLNTAFLDLTGNVNAQLVFALVGEVTGSQQWQKNLITQGLPGLSITNLISVGPFVTVDVGATADFTLQGGIEYGWTLDWPNVDASIDLLNPSGSITATGINPVVNKQFDFSETATLDASVFGLVALRFGIDVLQGKFVADVGLVDKPEGDFNAIQQIYSHNQLEALTDGTVVCGGVGADFSLIDSVYIEAVFGGAAKNNISTTSTYPLTTWTAFSTTTCFGQSSTISHGSSSTSSPSSSSSPVSSAPPTSVCGILQDSDGDEPDDDGDEVTTCVTGSDTTLLATTFAPTTTASSSASDFTPSSCDSNLDPTAFVACQSTVEAQIQSFEASVFALGLKKRALSTLALPTITTSPVITTPRMAAMPAELKPKLRRRALRKQEKAKRMDDPVMQTSVVALTNASLALSWADDGNLIVDGDGSRSLFSSIDGSIIGDSTGQRMLHLYNDTIPSLGVSRLRLAAIDRMPLPSVLVTLAPIPISSGQAAYVALTSAGDAYFPITCILDSQFPKVFLARDIASGITTLQDPGLAATLTGGNVTSCGYVPWGVSGQG